MTTLLVKRLPHAAGLSLPAYMTAHASGMDVYAAVAEPVTLLPTGSFAVPTGLIFEIPAGFEIQVRPRSGLALRHGIVIPNSPGTIDADYRGELQVILMNLGKEPFTIRRGDRIAQLVLCQVERVEWREVSELAESVRGAGGFGHTGISH